MSKYQNIVVIGGEFHLLWSAGGGVGADADADVQAQSLVALWPMLSLLICPVHTGSSLSTRTILPNGLLRPCALPSSLVSPAAC
jgi:hypothetical protein